MIIADINNIARIHGGRTIFKSVSWTIQDGEKIGLVGLNGVGKSTLLRALAGLEQPDAGAITLRRGARVAYLPQAGYVSPLFRCRQIQQQRQRMRSSMMSAMRRNIHQRPASPATSVTTKNTQYNYYAHTSHSQYNDFIDSKYNDFVNSQYNDFIELK